ncbi:hypothetical protein BDW02DRAFT_627945 [Decorospora gaudefroyi]|uniref:Nephrocystin 3-like N-terminal domain-containing protein n=1 Tax=Decorospora gaudefroyi TaxID=184978 RepID=A0A6A5KQF1_9PLEO|nr:hypothetical protein BDW02DRAFT_627945 [Decorospora gaudefroyi]
MAEVIGTISSIAQLVDISGALLAGGYSFLSKVARAPTEIRSLLTETAAINSLLGQLQQIADHSTRKSASDDALQALARVGVFKECEAELELIRKALAKCEQVHGEEAKNFGRRLLWPFKEKETKEALQRLTRLRGLLANAIEANSASALRRIEAGQGILSDEMKDMSGQLRLQISRDEAQRVVSWVCPQPSDGAHASLASALSRHVPGTGEWFLRSKSFQEWTESDTGTIWITGLPGSGKTLLCASIIHSVQQLCSDTTAVVYFFCDHRDGAKVTHESFIMSITRQMMEASSSCLEHAKRIYEERSKNGSRPFIRDEYPILLQSFVDRLKEVFIIVDALDESSEGDAIAQSLTAIHSFGERAGHRTKILLTSRFDIRLEGRYPNLNRTSAALADNMRPDIEHYIEAELDLRVAKGVLKLRNADLVPVIQRQISDFAGTILQARLQLDYVCTAKTNKEIKAMVQSLPNGLEYTYQTLLCNMKARHPEKLKDIKTQLRCLVTAFSPMTARELTEVLAMEPGARDLDHDSVVTDVYDALEPIADLIRTDGEGSTDAFVKICHYSLGQYLRSDNIRKGPANCFHVPSQDADRWMATICLQYLTFDVFAASSQQGLNVQLNETYAFRRYAALNWFRHVNSANSDSALWEVCSPYLDRFLDAGEGPPCYKRWQKQVADAYLSAEFLGYAPICFCIMAGLNDFAQRLIQRLPCLDHTFDNGHTCLTVAAKHNNLAMCQYLVQHGASIDKPTREPHYMRRLTPLHLATEYCARQAFEYLISNGADVHIQSTSEATPFYRACRGGDLSIVRRLKECGSDINARTWNNWTPILDAIGNDQAEVVAVLIEWGADLSVPSDEGWTVLSLAKAQNRISILEMIQRALTQFGVELPNG